MAVPSSKRRKLSHSPSPVEDDDVSIASDKQIEDMEDDAVSQDDKMDDAEELDEESDEGESEEEEEVQEKVTKAKDNKKGGRNVSQASALEASSAAYTGGTFKSNMFKLQVDQMLQNMRPRQGAREAAAGEALHSIKKQIDSMPTREPLPLLDAERDMIKKSKVAIPFPEPRPAHDVKYKLAYEKPQNINVVGSFPLKLSLRDRHAPLSIDMLVTMPKSLFQEKDYLNHRYFYKRAFYLACIAAALKSSLKDLVFQFVNFRNNPLHPVLLVQPKESTSENNWRINIIPGIPEGTFADNKLLPNKNCVRPSQSGGDDEQTQDLAPTPFYNAAIQADSHITSYLKLLHASSTSCEGYTDACMLGRVWLRQRGLASDTNKGGFGNFEWAATMANLLRTGAGSGKPVLSSGYSSYQLFKATLQYLAVKDLAKEPALLDAAGVTLATENGQPILYDGPRAQNILYKMTNWSYQHLRAEARTTLKMLGDNLFDQFDSAFILRSDNILKRYDLAVRVPCSALTSEITEDRQLLERYAKLHAVVSQGLGDRATQVVIQSPDHESWALGSARPQMERKGELLVAVNLDATNAARAVDHGPAAEQKKEAAAFRKFWGEKAELRRFRDGSILESLVWATNAGMSIIQQILTFLLYRHFGQEAAASAVFSGDECARLIKQSNGLVAFQPLMEAFKTLESDIRGMDDLPLTIRSILASDSQLRYSSIEPPLSSQRQMKRPAGVVLQFEGSGRWPDDLVAIQRTKIAFLLKIGELFGTSQEDVTHRIGLENEGEDILNQAFLDVIYPTGFSFRIRIHHDREQTLIERVLKSQSAAPSEKETAAVALVTYKRVFIKSPTHTQALQKLCTRYPVLSPTVRLMKKWFSEHLLSNHFSEEVIELFAIHTFTRPWPYNTPSSTQAAFLRTLSFLSRFDWRADPLIVDLGGDLNTDNVAAATTRFEAWRKLDPALNRVVLFVASSDDLEGTTWTDGTPAKVVCGRMTALAKAATAEVEAKSLSLDVETLFVSPLGDYDFVIHLNPTSAKSKAASGKYKNLAIAEETNADLVDYSPTDAFFQELQNVYGQSLALFYGGPGSTTIAGLWSPVTAARAWKVNLSYSTVPVKKGEEVIAEFNKTAVLAEMARLGGGLVRKIEANR
ncbi:Nrap protein [Aureobasidium subglaciale]|nr:Nrap protein [Aureobasidium subglaciale]